MKQRKFMAPLALAAVMAAAATPATVQAGGTERLDQCLEASQSATNPELARSHCLWNHYSYMASYGR